MGRKRNLRVRSGSVFAGVSWDLSRPLGMGMENIEMNRIGTFRAALVALIPIVAIAFGSAALAQTPAPAASPTATPAPAPSATPVPPPAETKSPADTVFTFLAEIPVDQDPKNLTKDMSMGKSPDGKALKFVHRGSYDNMDNTYEAITNHLDDKKLEAKDMFVEEYLTDPLKTAEDKLVINVYVPLK